jgi:hypothetical protein
MELWCLWIVAVLEFVTICEMAGRLGKLERTVLIIDDELSQHLNDRFKMVNLKNEVNCDCNKEKQ